MQWRVKLLGLSDLYGPEYVAPTQYEEGIAQAEMAARVVDEPSNVEVITSNAGQIKLKEPTTLDERIIEHLFTKGEFKQYTFTDAFVRGQQTKAIRILQRKLQRLGYIPKDRGITGIYDATTIDAIYAFQLAE